MTILTVEILRSEATVFSAAESRHLEPLLYGVTDGKAVGTYLEQKFRNPPIQGFLTISNALQWRLQYGRVIERAGQEEGIIAVYRANS